MSKSKKLDQSASELFYAQLENSEPNFYTRVPNIIDHLTYTTIVDGKKEVHRLSVYAKELYRVIRMIASDTGKCWNTGALLALKVGCSTGMITKAMKELLMPMDQLDGNALIVESRRFKEVVRDDGTKYAVTLCTRTVVNIWNWNNAFMATLSYQTQYGRRGSISCDEIDGGSISYDEMASLGSVSLSEANNNSLNNNPLLNKQPTEAEAPDPVCPSEEVVQLSEDEDPLFTKLVGLGFKNKVAKELIDKYPLEYFNKAFTHIKKVRKEYKVKGKVMTNPNGYFIKTLENKYWIS